MLAFDRRREEGPEPGPLHQGNGERSSGHHIRHRATRQRSHQSTRHGSRLGGSATGAPGDLVGEGDEERTPAGDVQHRAEKHEEIDEVGRDAEGNPPESLGREVDVLDEPGRRISPVSKQARQIRARETVGQRQHADADEAPARGASSQLEDQDDGDTAPDEVEGGRLARARHELPVLQDQIDARRHGKRRQQPPQGSARTGERGLGAVLTRLLLDAYAEEPQRGHQREVDGPLDERGERRHTSGIHVEEAGGYRCDGHDQSGNPTSGGTQASSPAQGVRGVRVREPRKEQPDRPGRKRKPTCRRLDPWPGNGDRVF